VAQTISHIGSQTVLQDSDHSLCTDIEPKEERDEQVTPYWIDHYPEMRKGVVDFLSSKEEQFWKDLIDKYLYVLVKNATASIHPRNIFWYSE
jgi:hypothetical protein